MPQGIGTISRGCSVLLSLRIQATPFPRLTRSASSCFRIVKGLCQVLGRTLSSSVTGCSVRSRLFASYT